MIIYLEFLLHEIMAVIFENYVVIGNMFLIYFNPWK